MNILNARPRVILAGLLMTLMFTACLSDSPEPTIDLNATGAPESIIALPSPTPTAEPEPTPSRPPWLSELLEPGTASLVSPALFFLNGPDVWLIDGDLDVRQVTRERRVRHVATVPGSDSAAVVLIGSQGGRETEEIRIIDADGSESDPIYGPEIVGDPAGNPRVTTLAWSADGTRLAIIRSDGSIWIGGIDETAEPISTDAPTDGVRRAGWSPTGNALYLVIQPPSGPGSVRIIPLDSEDYFEIEPLQSLADACWVPGQSRLILTEERTEDHNPNAGSLFSIRPDGSERQLLVSAGEFGPAVSIGKIVPSPDGTHLAFTVEAPDGSGVFRFRSLYVMELSSGVRRELPVMAGQLINDIWWIEGGLAWRTTSIEDGEEYDGVEPFLIEASNLETGDTGLIFTSNET